MFSRTTIASSTTNPVEIVSAMRERLSRLYPKRYMTPKEGEDDQDHEQDRDQERQLDVPQRRPDRGRPVEDDRELDRRRDGGRELRDQGADAIDRLNDVRRRLPIDDQQHRRLAVHQPR